MLFALAELRPAGYYTEQSSGAAATSVKTPYRNHAASGLWRRTGTARLPAGRAGTDWRAGRAAPAADIPGVLTEMRADKGCSAAV